MEMTSRDHMFKGLRNLMSWSHHLAKFSGHRPVVDFRYVTTLVCHVILQDHVIVQSYDFMGRSHAK